MGVLTPSQGGDKPACWELLHDPDEQEAGRCTGEGGLAGEGRSILSTRGDLGWAAEQVRSDNVGGVLGNLGALEERGSVGGSQTLPDRRCQSGGLRQEDTEVKQGPGSFGHKTGTAGRGRR